MVESERRDVPIFLSIGYSTCHWCHVMARESFRDKDIARSLNAAFVCIKVDREERPDIDDLYMKAAVAMTGSGGWPLTLVLTPQRRPIFAATYLPPRSRNGSAGLEDVIRQISAAWRSRRDEVEALGGEVMRFLTAHPPAPGQMDGAMWEKGYAVLEERFEERYGGFGGPLKFPTPHKLMFLLRYWYAEGPERAMEMVERTMYNLVRGGIHDQLGGGFHRYSTDIKWLVPHFEKMLCDQAMLSMAYTELYQARGRPWAKEAAIDILDYVLARMRSPQGLFYAAEDADSGGREGAFYLWTYEEVRAHLKNEDLEYFLEAYDVRREGNFRDSVSNMRDGSNILHLEKDAETLTLEKGRTVDSIQASLRRARGALLKARDDRERPFRDEKCLLDWNGLMLAALAKAGAAFAEERLLQAAIETQAALEKHMRGRAGMIHTYFDGEAKIPAFLNDHAFYAWGLLELHQATLDDMYLDRCREEMREIQSGFKDQEGSLFLSREGEVRTRDVYDGALPSGSSVAAFVAARIGVFDENMAMEAQSIVEASWQQVAADPEAHLFMLMAAQLALQPPARLEVGEGAEALLQALRPELHPRLMVRRTASLQAGARLCGQGACLPAPRTPEELRTQLRQERA